MIEGITGSLVTHHFAEQVLPTAFAGRLGEASRERARRALRAWCRRDGLSLGPASPLRAVFDLGAAPIASLLGFSARQPRLAAAGGSLVADAVSRAATVPLLVSPWGAPLDAFWNAVSRECLAGGGGWALGFNGRSLRLYDSRRIHSRDYLEIDLERAADHPAACAVFWGVLRADALGSVTAEIIDSSARHGVAVTASLREGVREALALFLQGLASATDRRARLHQDAGRLASTLDQAFTIVYRVLFLLFAESRGLVPSWHPVYRHGYTIEALRRMAERPGSQRGLWEGLQAISRLAHAGCRAGSLTVEPFNGRLFAPAHAPLAESGTLDDGLVARALMALTTVGVAGRRERVSFGDLGVEQLGAVYESVLEYEPAIAAGGSRAPGRRHGPGPAPAVTLVARGGARKSSGTFYTPRPITDYLVRHTLGPLVHGAKPDDILGLRVLDPAMGSGALLVAACRFLAEAYEAALVRERGRFACDVTDEERAGFRRLVAQRCLYGVDLNPMAVHVARLSMWLTTLANGKPLSFLDHHLVCGDSLVGASPEDLARQPPGGRSGARAAGACPLFDADEAAAALHAVVPMRNRLAGTPDDTADAVRAKARLLARVEDESPAFSALRRVADLWCACWFWTNRDLGEPGPAEYGELARLVRSGSSGLPARIAQPKLAEAKRLAAKHRFLHWTLEFPEVFFDEAGAPLAAPGFDAVIGNPPWEMLRGDTGTGEARAGRRLSASLLSRFARRSGIYLACAEGHANEYQLFVERSVRLLRPGGRLGLVLPWGLASDHGSAALRRLLFERCDTDAIVGFENSEGIFPIHRGVRFMLVSSSPGRPTRQTRCRLGERDPAVLEEPGGDAPRGDGASRRVTMTPGLLARVGGPGLAIPCVRTETDLRLLERAAATVPALADPRGWGASFGRELNASDDRALLSSSAAGMPVVEGKHLDPFDVRLEECKWRVPRCAALPGERLRGAVGRHRLAYRDVASATNRLTLIAAVVPPGAVTVHTVFCLRQAAALDDLVVLCCLMNSFVANYLVRMWVTTHLGAATVERLPVPRPRGPSWPVGRLVELGHALLKSRGRDGAAWAEVQAVAAGLYGLSAAEFRHVIESFPLVDGAARDGALEAFGRLAGRLGPV